MADKTLGIVTYTGSKPRHVVGIPSDRPVGPNGKSLTRRITTSKSFADSGTPLTIAEIDGAHVYVDTSGGVTTLPLPTPTSAEEGMVTSFKRLGANAIIVSGAIDGGASFTLATDKESVELTYIHSLGEWHITGRLGVGSGGSLWTDLGSYLQPAGGEGIQLPATWNGPHIIFGSNHIWMDSGGVARIKSSAPISEFDGLPLGSQS